MILEKPDIKEISRILGIFVGILTFIFSISILLIHFSNKKWNEGLKNIVSVALDEKEDGKWAISKNINIASPFSTAACLFEVIDKHTGEKCYAIILRTTTLYGAYPAIFLYNKTKGADFVCYANVSGRVKTLLEQNTTSTHICYWTKKVEKLIENSLEYEDKQGKR